MLSIDSAEENTRYKILKERSEAIRSCLEPAEKFELLQREASSLEAQLHNAMKDLEISRGWVTNGARFQLMTSEPQFYREAAEEN